ncbi:hypothetical protein CC80DRAFT_286315 [Byssothecium circinans]|uniref:Amino acid transporter transmembrane domain-containing protein n=1 Tax=Byssothecium circinans TaxID=147558 RepID=A0A6A5U825_9PLEO|nr:hypothetical protein CC80DRAFT_286315 [Byssothecium circinans]
MPVVTVREGSASSTEERSVNHHKDVTTAKEEGLDDILPKNLVDQASTRPLHEDSESQAQHQGDKPRDAFGNEEGAEIQYRTCEWWHAGMLMVAEVISLGVLALPQALASLGLVPGLLLIVILGIIATYTGYLIGQFKLAYPDTQSFADCGQRIAGPIGREVMAFAQVLILIFIMAAHVLSFAIALNAITGHATCTVVFSVASLVISFVLGLPRTLKNVSYLSIASCVSIVVAVLIAMIGIGISKPDMGKVLAVQPDVPLVKALGPAMNIVLAYAGHVAFFSFTAELKDPRDFPKALVLMQCFAVCFYVIIAVVIYYFAGPHVTSPALGSASPLITKIAFGVALLTIVIAGVVNGSVACKYIYLRVWKGTDVVHQNSVKSLGSWVGICAAVWVAAWAVAEAVPNFNLLLGLIAALFCSWFSYGLPAILFLYQYKGCYFESKKRAILTVVNCGIVVLACAICGLGMWSSGYGLARGSAGKPFSCEDNWRPSSG